jgi:catechol 2,3-dioxygenase-like lactoylglutathione lyase family enzyme
MKDYLICGLQQIGVGVKDLKDAWKWYIDKLGMDCRIFEEKAEATLMKSYTGGQSMARHAVLAMNLQGGGGFEIWQYTGKTPIGAFHEIKLGNLGIYACKIKVKNINKVYDFFTKTGTPVLGPPAEDPSGKNTFFINDPFGNTFQLVEAFDWFMNEKKNNGGSYGAIIGVTDVEKSRAVYSDILGYNEVEYDMTGTFSDLKNLPGGNAKMHRVLLKKSGPVPGPFGKLLGKSQIELISAEEHNKDRIFEGRHWGDLGFIHLCFDIVGMEKLKDYCGRSGYPFTIDSQTSSNGNSFDMGEAAGHFSYIEDPDRTLIEFVETHKIPIAKKLGWYLNLQKRDPSKNLPDWILKFLRFSRTKF